MHKIMEPMTPQLPELEGWFVREEKTDDQRCLGSMGKLQVLAGLHLLETRDAPREGEPRGLEGEKGAEEAGRGNS